MTTIRSAVTAAFTAGLLALPAAAGAVTTPSEAATPPATRAAAARFDTRIGFLQFHHTLGYHQIARIRGQLVATVNGQSGAVAGKRLTLQRRLAGTSRWATIRHTRTTNTAHPYFVFSSYARANASYRVAFAGDAKLQPAQAFTSIRVHRAFNRTRVTQGSLVFTGHLTPRYRHQVVFLDQRRCATCAWTTVGKRRTSALSRFRFVLSAPRSGRWWWKAHTPGTARFLQSHSPVWYTRTSTR